MLEKYSAKPSSNHGSYAVIEVSIHQLVSILVKDHCPGILVRHVEHDEASVASALKKSSNLSGLAAKNWRDLPHLLCVPKGHNLKRHR